MTRGMKMAVAAHVGGTILSIAVAWVFVGHFAREDSRSAMQYAVLVGGVSWGIWMLRQTLIGHNKLANQVVAIFDRKDR